MKPCKKCEGKEFRITKRKSYILLPDGMVGKIRKSIHECIKCGDSDQCFYKEELIATRKFVKEDTFSTKDGHVYWNDVKAVLMSDEHGSLVIKKESERNAKKYKPYEDKVEIKTVIIE